MNRSYPRHSIRLCITAFCLSLFVCQAVAEDWARWMGPERTNTWTETGLIEKFPAGGPKVLWRTKVANGYAGPAVAAGRVVVTDFVTDADVKIANFERQEFDGNERVLCLDEKTGEILWEHKYPVRYTISYPSGPRCTPIIENKRVYTLGAEGHLICLSLDDGAVVWSKELKKEYNTTSALWGYSAHPLIDGDNLITLAGGKGSHIVALNKSTGQEVWRSLTSVEQGYSPPTIIEAGGTRQLITLRPDAVSSLDPVTGKELWSVPYEATSNSIIMSPLKIGEYLYAAGYSNKSLLLKLDSGKPAVSEIWRDQARSAISPVNVQPYLDASNQIVYGMDQTGDLRATQFPDGELLWETSKPVSERRVGSGTAFIIRQGQSDRYWLFNENGELIIAEMTAKGYQEIDRAKVIETSNNAFNRPVVWSMPAFANQRAYIRNDNEIIGVDLAKK